jgi:hypothetical protein
MLLIHRGTEAGSGHGQQVHGYAMYASALRDQLNLDVTAVAALEPEPILQQGAAEGFDLLALLVHWSWPVERVIELLQQLRAQQPGRRLVLIDWYDQTSSSHFAALPHLDLYLKRQTLRDLDSYRRDLAGDYIFTDFLARQLDYDLDGWHFGSALPADQQHKLVTTHNFGVTPRYRRLLKLTRRSPLPWRARPFLLNRRFGAISHNDQREWYQAYRDQVQRRLEDWGNRFRCTGTGRLRSKAYLLEMNLSKIALSPFGWGEVCHRDYEAVACGALLMKPSMEHLTTSPDIFVAEQTYVPIRWDLADLDEKIEHYRTRSAEATRIIAQARQVLGDYFERGGFLDDTRRMLDALPDRAAA